MSALRLKALNLYQATRIPKAVDWTRLQVKNHPVATRIIKRSAITTAAVGGLTGRAPWAASLALFSILEIPPIRRGITKIRTAISDLLSGINGLLKRLWPFTSKSEGSRSDIDQDIDRIV